jgi:hypothetical protein
VEGNNGIACIVLFSEHALQLSFADLLFQRDDLFFKLGRRLFISSFRHLQEDMSVFQPFYVLFPLRNYISKRGAFLENGLGLFLILPELICRSQVIEFSSARFFAGDVKDASRALRLAGLDQRVSLLLLLT